MRWQIAVHGLRKNKIGGACRPRRVLVGVTGSGPIPGISAVGRC